MIDFKESFHAATLSVGTKPSLISIEEVQVTHSSSTEYCMSALNHSLSMLNGLGTDFTVMPCGIARVIFEVEFSRILNTAGRRRLSALSIGEHSQFHTGGELYVDVLSDSLDSLSVVERSVEAVADYKRIRYFHVVSPYRSESFQALFHTVGSNAAANVVYKILVVA